MRGYAVVLVILAAAVGTGCGGREAVAASRPAPAGTDTTPASETYPDTTGPALWAFLDSSDFRTWPLWPGKGRFFPGEQPHGALLTVFVEPGVRDALLDGAERMPPRAVIVKENYGPDSTLRAHTVMYKVPGYDPQHHDWFWGQYAPDGKVLAAGRVQLCWQCHEVAAPYDDLWILRDEAYLRRLNSGR